MLKQKHRLAVGTALTALLTIAASAAHAQAADPVAPDSGPVAAADDRTASLEEIVVTAQKRSENLQDVPISVTAITGSTLNANRVLSTRDLQFVSPSLVYNTAANNAQPFLRGIGSDLVGPNLDASVATYIDGVYLSNGNSLVTGLFGIDRVEVLAGPQGTLFGRNAVGGAISIVTMTPNSDFKARIALTGGNYDRRQAEGYVSGPITETLSVGVYGIYNRRDTYYKVSNPMDPDHETMKGIRVKAVWNPFEALRLTGSLEYTNQRGVERAALRNIQPDALGYALGGRSIIKNYVYEGDAYEFMDYSSKSATLREELDLGWADLVGITGYRHSYGTNGDDLDGTNANFLATSAAGGGNRSKQFSQELQLLSPAGNRITWIAGLYYFRERTGYYPTGTISPVLFGPGIGASETFSQVITKSYAAFGQATIPLDGFIDNVRLTLGGRYTKDKKDFSASGRFITGTGLVGPIVQVGPTIVYPDSHKSWAQFTPKATLDYKVGDTLFYGSYSRGFKGGAYNIAAPADPGPVSPEKLSAFELGVKSEFADGRIRLNLAAYHYEFKDLQVQIIAVSSATELQNAGKGRAMGIEGSLSAAVTRNLTLNGGIAVADTKYTDFQDAASYLFGPGGNASASFDATGNDLQRAPKLVFNLGADYNYEFADGSGISASAKWYHNDGFFWEATNRFRESAYDVVNLSATYTLPGKNVSITVFGSNITDSHYRTTILPTPVSILTSDAEPRMYGATLTLRY